jgi:2-keto-4-pentenoate hydratase
MWMPGKVDVYAHQLMEVRAAARILPLLSDVEPLSLQDANSIARRILDFRMAQGEKPVGKKIYFNVRSDALFGQPDKRDPIWAPIYDTTIRYADNNMGVQSLLGAIQPCIAPQIVFKIGTTPLVGATIDELSQCVDWVAHGLEIVSCPFAGWQFTIADAIAAFGLHGTLIIGDPTTLSYDTQTTLQTKLNNASLTLSGMQNADGIRSGVGFSSATLDNPVYAMWHLHQLLNRQSLFKPLHEGDLVSVGVWTEAYPVGPNQTWTSTLSGVHLPSMTLHLV